MALIKLIKVLFGNMQNKEKKQRTLRQSRAMHQYFKMVSDEARNTGITFSEFIRLRPRLEMPWTPERAKEIWKTAQMHMFGTTSTRDLTTGQIDQVYDVVNKVLGEILHFNIPFPSIEEQMLEEL